MSTFVNSTPATCFNNEPLALPTAKSLSSFTFDLDALVLISLLYQFVLVMVAPWRKHSLFYIVVLIEFVYVQAIYLANYAVGLVPNKRFQGGRTSDLRLFWAPFLLLHLGGPNTLSSLSHLDNDIWLRYGVRLLTLSYTLARVFFHNFFLTNGLWLPTILVYFAGLLKYLERLISLFNARLTKFREASLPEPDPGESYASLMRTHTSFQRSAANQFDPCALEFQMSESDHIQVVRTRGLHANRKLSQVQIVKEAYRLFQEFKGLFVNSVYTYDQRDISREFFLNSVADAEDAFSICEVELNFAYDVFYTKAIFINKTKWPVINLATFLLQLVALVLWFRLDKCPIRTSSMYVTQTLVYGSLALDLLSLLMFFTSDWNIAMVRQKKIDAKSFFSNYFCERMLLFKKRSRERYRKGRRLVPINFFGRWSERLPQMNLIDTSANKLRFGKLVSHVLFTNELRNFIFEEAVTRSCWAQKPRDVEGLCSTRGMWFLARYCLKYKDTDSVTETSFSPWITDVEYEESLILWHIATTLCAVLEDADSHTEDPLFKFSNILSNYMLHHLILEPTLMIPPTPEIIGKMIYRDTFAEANLFFNRVLPRWYWFKVPNKKKRLQSACEKMIQVTTDVVSPKEIRGNESKSVLFDGCILAKKLIGLEKDHGIKRWEIISGVWVEMLFYCAAHSSPTKHVENLLRGGDLLTIVWLLMAHLGLGKHFRYNKAKDTRAQLVQHQ